MRQLFALCLCLAVLNSCRDDFSLEAPAADIPVVYAYLDASATDNFIRVERVFVESGGNANEVAQIADSLFYDAEDAVVSITSAGETVELERVNGDDLGMEREPGTFIETPNILYRLSDEDMDLIAGRTAVLTVATSSGVEATGSTVLIPEVNITTPSVATMGLNPGNYARSTVVRWQIGDEGRVFDIRFYFNIREFSLSNPGQVTEKRLEMVIDNAFVRPQRLENALSYSIDNELFWQFLNSQLEPDPDIRRSLDNIDLVLAAVGSEVEDLLEVAQANAGITSSQAIPVFSNIENGLGIITSRSIATEMEMPLNPASRDTLRNGIYTRDLGFQ